MMAWFARLSAWKLVGLFLLVVLVLHLDDFLLGTHGAIRHLDVADQYIDKFQTLGAFWRSPYTHSWNASMLRGWPMAVGSVLPQQLGSLLGAVLPSYAIMPILAVIAQTLLMVGSFVFLRGVLGYGVRTSLYGTLLHLSLYYWRHENPFVNEAMLLPALCVCASYTGYRISGVLRGCVLAAVIMLSYPPYTLPIMCGAHGLIIWALFPPQHRRSALWCAVWFWCAYVIYYAPSLLGFFQNLAVSNRALWEASSVPGESLGSVVRTFLTSRGTLFPGLLLLALSTRSSMDRRWWRYGGVFVGIVLFTALSQSAWWSGLTPLKMTSFVYGRIYNFVGFVLFLWIAHVLHTLPAWPRPEMRTLRWLGCFCLLLMVGIAYGNGTDVTVLHALVMGWTALLVLVQPFRKATGWGRVLALLCLSILPFRLQAVAFEKPHYANLFSDTFSYDASVQPFRVATVMDGFASETLYPAQVSIRQLETIDGFSVFYDRRDAEQWTRFLKAKATTSDSQAFLAWNNRVELYDEEFAVDPDQIVRWWWLQNVEFVRSLIPLRHPALTPVAEQEAPLWGSWKSLLKGHPLLQRRYLYRLTHPLSRVFAASGLDRDTRTTDEALLDRLGPETVTNITLDRYAPGHLQFTGDFPPKKTLLASTNFNPGWNLFIDDRPAPQRLGEGPFGMLQVAPIAGRHTYTLVFHSVFVPMLLCMGFAGLLLGVGAARVSHYE